MQRRVTMTRCDVEIYGRELAEVLKQYRSAVRRRDGPALRAAAAEIARLAGDVAGAKFEYALDGRGRRDRA